jgi:hypothetical protein
MLARNKSPVSNISDGSGLIANKSDHLKLDSVAETRVVTGAKADDATHVEQMQLITRVYLCRHVSDETFERAPATKDPNQ